MAETRDYLLVYINGQRVEVRGGDAFASLSDFLRYRRQLTGTKIVCSEGDCGACTVLLGRAGGNGELTYQVVNSCIQFLWQLDCAHVITVEGLRTGEALTPVQERMVACHASQCGFCTPGFVMALTAVCRPGEMMTPTEVKEGLTGNLCRCTGYLPILEAALTGDRGKIVPPERLYPSKEIAADFAGRRAEAVVVHDGERTLCKPADVGQAVAFLSENPGTMIFAGGTDLGVRTNKGMITPKTVLSVGDLRGAADVRIENDALSIGPAATWSGVETLVKDRLPELHRILILFGSPQIRNAGTVAGNIANASPIADSLPFLYVMEATVELTGPGGVRRVQIDRFYKGYKKLDLNPGELITRIVVPLPAASQVLKLYKISKRKHLDISTFTGAVLMRLSGSQIGEIRVAYGGVGPTVLRLPKTEAFLAGKEFSEQTFKEAGTIAASEVTPISDVRASKDYRTLLARNVMMKFFRDHEHLAERQPVTVN
jgi:xanthine dehydrogenase small subunit